MEKLTKRETIIDSNGNVSFNYPSNYTQQQRGYTPPVGVKGYFKGLRASKPISSRIASSQEISQVNKFKTGVGIVLSPIIRSLYGLSEKFNIKRTTAYRKQAKKNRAK